MWYYHDWYFISEIIKEGENIKRIVILLITLALGIIVCNTVSAAVPDSPVTNNTANQTNPAISGNIVVWEDSRDGNSTIYYKNLTTGAEEKVTNQTKNLHRPAISGNIVVWDDYDDETGQVYYKNLATGIEGPVSPSTKAQYDPAISGNIVVWVELGGYSDQHIYYKNLQTGDGGRLSSFSGAEYNPAISGNIVVWSGIPLDMMSESNIYYKNLTTGTETQISTLEHRPDVSGNTIVSQFYYWEYNGEFYSELVIIKYKNLADNYEQTIATNGSNPKISGNNIVWDDYYEEYGGHVYYKILGSDNERISSSDLPQRSPAISGNIVVWEDYRNGNWDIYYATLPSVLPDLVVQSISGPTTGYNGKTISVTSTMKNIGTATAGAFYTKFYLSKDTNITSSDTYLGQRHITSLAVGASNTATNTFTIPAGLAAGSYYIGAITDATNIITESDETNNKKYSLTKINILSKPDLIVSGPSNSIVGSRGKNITFTTKIKNIGTAKAGAFYTRFYLYKDIYLGQKYIASLNPGATITIKSTLTLPATLTGEYYYLRTITDTTNTINELDETNNEYIGPMIYIPGRDLIISSLTGPKTGFLGKTITITNTVKNTGYRNTTGFYTKFYLSKDTKYTSNDIYLGQRKITSLKGGATNTAKSSFKIPTKTAKGTYYIIAIADAINEVLEFSETNNIKYTGKISIQSRADLTITQLTTPTKGTRGKTIKITNTIKNTGTLSTGKFYTKFYLSKDKKFSKTDIYLGQRTITSLKAGKTSTAKTTLKIPIKTAKGTYYIIAITDATKKVTEISETNNNKYTSKKLTVK